MAQSPSPADRGTPSPVRALSPQNMTERQQIAFLMQQTAQSAEVPTFAAKAETVTVGGGGAQKAAGSDSEGRKFGSRDEMWKAELGRTDVNSEDGWYGKALKYWETIPASVDGVLGGFAHVSPQDLRESGQFIQALEQSGKIKIDDAPNSYAVDCGAGIGRITEGLLLHRFTKVDLVEPVKSFLGEAILRLSKTNQGEFLQVGLQEFDPPAQKYDCVWIQWVIGHLHDADCVEFLQRCRKAIKPNGFIMLKENTCGEEFIVDKDDSSVTRSDKFLRELISRSGATLIEARKQMDFPRELFPVYMYAFR